MDFSNYDPSQLRSLSKESLTNIKNAIEALGWRVWGFRAEFDKDLNTNSLKVLLTSPTGTTNEADCLS